MKKAFFLVGDYWHHKETIEPLKNILYPETDWEVIFTERPEILMELNEAPDLIISFKDPIENDQIPTPVWCDEAWTNRLFEYVRDRGTGLLLVHAALTDMDEDHPIVRDMVQGMFKGHPQQCPVTFKPVREHEILEGIDEFILPENDEHYMMDMFNENDVQIIAQTESENGIQPGLWVRHLGNGRVCCITSGHTTKNLISEGYVKLMKNASKWCCR